MYMRDPLRVALTGAGGQLGTDVVIAAAARADIELIPFDRRHLDVCDPAQTAAVLGAAEPDVVIHGAAWTNVDDCEGDPERAMAVNGGGTENVLAGAQGAGARTIIVSTDYVFDGSKPEPYLESDETNPVSAYGRSKVAAERLAGEDDLVVRTSWVSGLHGDNMVKTILRIVDRHPTLRFVDDQIGKPTFSTDLARALLDLAILEATGICHVTNQGVVSWYEFCRQVLITLDLDPDRVEPCRTDELVPPRPAPRPANSVLEDTRLAELGCPPLRDYREPLREIVEELLLRAAI